MKVTPSKGALLGHEAFARSDQAAFAAAGVPAMLINEGFDWAGHTEGEAVHRLWGWFESRYHTPFDDLEQELDFEAATLHCGAILAVAWAVADGPKPPQWRPGAPYAYERMLSLAEHER